MSPELTDKDLSPGADCPVCGEQIVTWYGIQKENEDACTLPAEGVEMQGPGHGIDADYIEIDHEGPSL